MDVDRLTDLPARELVERLSTKEPIPGGGSASALAGAIGAALVRMVVALTAGRADSAEHERELTDIAAAAASLQSELLSLTEADATAYDAVVRARRLPRTTDLERQSRQTQVAAAMRDATRIPLQTAQVAEQVLALAERVAPIGNRNAVSDAGVGALLAVAAVRGAVLNVRINLPWLDDEALRTQAADDVAALVDRLDERERAVQAAVAERLG